MRFQKVVVAEVFAVRWQLVVYQIWQDFLQLKEESFAGLIVIGPHLKANREFISESLKKFQIFFIQQRCRRDGYCLMSCREHGPAVGATFGDIEFIARLQQVQDGQVVDGALRTLREAESGQPP